MGWQEDELASVRERLMDVLRVLNTHGLLRYGMEPFQIDRCLTDLLKALQSLHSAVDEAMGDSDLIDGEDSHLMEAMQRVAGFLKSCVHDWDEASGPGGQRSCRCRRCGKIIYGTTVMKDNEHE